MTTSLQGIANKARREKKYRFRDLYKVLNERFLTETWFTLNRRSASGVDRVSISEFRNNLKENVTEIIEALKRKRYRAQLIRRVYIPKGDGRTRALGIPAIGDRLLQAGAARILSAIYEEDFLPLSFGYRPGMGARKAVQALTVTLQREKLTWVVDADIKGFFDSMDHEWMKRMLEERIDDSSFIRLISKWLKAGVLNPEGSVEHPVTGTQQGGVISPVLSNIYLHYVLDLWFEKVVKPRCRGEAYLIRYADDFIAAFRYRRDADRFYEALGKRLNKFKLSLSPEKTQVIKFTRFQKEKGKCFDFLGFEFRWGIDRKGKDLIKRRTSRKNFRASLRNVKQWCRDNRNYRLRKLFDLLNAKLRGYYYYYGIIGNYASLESFFEEVKRILYKWLNRRSQRKSFNYKAFREILNYYGIEKPRITEVNKFQLTLFSQ